MKRLLSTLLLLIIAPHVNAQFVAGQVLGAAQLNAALASPTITSGTINGAPIGQSDPRAVNATSVGIVGATSGTVSILPQSAAGTYNFNLPTTAGASGSVLTSGGGSSTPMTWTPQASLAVGSATVATQASTALKSDNVSYYPMMGSAASNTNQTFNVSSGLSFNPTVGLNVTGSMAASGALSLTSASVNHGARQDRALLWTYDGNPLSTIRAGIYGTSTDELRLAAGSGLTTSAVATATGFRVAGILDLGNAAINTYNSGASKWSYFNTMGNTFFAGSTGFYVNDQANTKSILSVLGTAPNNSMVIGATGTSITGALSATEQATFTKTGGTSDSTVQLSNATYNILEFYASGASVDQKRWGWQSGSAVGDGIFRLRALNDARTSGIDALSFSRSGVSSVDMTTGGNARVSGVLVAGNQIATSGAKIIAGYYSGADVLTTFGSMRSTGGPVVGYAVWPSLSGAGFISAASTYLARGAYDISGNIHTWYGASAQTVAVDSPITLSSIATLTPTLFTVNAPISVTDATDSSSTTTGSLKTAGGLGVAKKAYFGDSVATAGNFTLSTSGTSVAFSGGDSLITSTTGGSFQISTGGAVTNGNIVVNAKTNLFNQVNSATIGIYTSSGLNIADGKTLSVGSGSGTSAGLIAGYCGSSGYGCIWSTGVTPSTSNYALASRGDSSVINGTTNSILAVNATPVLTATSTSVTTVQPFYSVGDVSTDPTTGFDGQINIKGASDANKRLALAVNTSTDTGVIQSYTASSAYRPLALNPSGGSINFSKTITAEGTTGAQTINKTTGRVNFAAAATSLVVTNSLVATTSIIQCTVATNDTTMKSVACVPGSGSFTIHANAAPTAETAVAFTVTN